MVLRNNHYDAAFEEYLRARRAPYVAVDEQRRTLMEEASLKSMDFIVYSPRERNLLIDVKGRRFPSGGADNGNKWENWTTADDVPSLLKWEDVFGPDFRALLVFAYHLVYERDVPDFDDVFTFRDRRYAFYGVWVDDYSRAMRQRSASWETVALPRASFRELRFPIAQYL